MNMSKFKWMDIHWLLIFFVMLIGIFGVYNLHSAAVFKEVDFYLI